MNQGKVILVGAGCGPDLITVAGLRELEKAESVVYDDLIDQGLLEYTPEDCHRIYVGKRSGRHSKAQEEINQILIEEAKKGYRVVRLKGGDSFVFGRGGEEILALQKEGIPYRMIPGVTSSVAVPESLGIPVTHRKVARSFSVITGHTADSNPQEEKERWDALAKVGGTLVFLMGLHSAKKISDGLMAAGMPGDRPASILSRGYTVDAKRIDGDLASLEKMAEEASTPSVIVVGDVAALHMEATDQGELSNQSVTLTGSDFFTKRLALALEKEGAYVRSYPYVKLITDKDAIPEMDELSNHWLVFTSSNGVRIFFEYLKEKKLDLRCLFGAKFACIGAGTEKTLAEYGFYADLIPEDYTAKALGEKLSRDLQGSNEKIHILRAANGSIELNAVLDQAGIQYQDHKIYHTVIATDRLPQEEIHTNYLVFASKYGAKGFFEQRDPLGIERIQDLYKRIHTGEVRVICIGEITGEEVKKHLSDEDSEKLLIAKKHTVEGILEQIRGREE